MLIKASTITNLTDARYFAAKDVDFLGFNLEEGTPDYLDPMYMKAIREWVEGPKIVGEFDQTPARTVLEAARFFELDAVQVRQTNDLELLEGLEVMLVVPAPENPTALEALFQKTAPLVSYFLLDFSSIENAATKLEMQAAAWKTFFNNYPTLLDLQVAADVLPGLLAQLNPAGLALRGGDEERVGVKSFDEIDAVFDVL
jgi:phosphoribosylanthranilate isomerase